MVKWEGPACKFSFYSTMVISCAISFPAPMESSENQPISSPQPISSLLLNQLNFCADWDSPQETRMAPPTTKHSTVQVSESRKFFLGIGLNRTKLGVTRLTRPENRKTRPSQTLFIRVLLKNSHRRGTRAKLGPVPSDSELTRNRPISGTMVKAMNYWLDLRFPCEKICFIKFCSDWEV